jgi:hypothetical protein
MPWEMFASALLSALFPLSDQFLQTNGRWLTPKGSVGRLLGRARNSDGSLRGATSTADSVALHHVYSRVQFAVVPVMLILKLGEVG